MITHHQTTVRKHNARGDTKEFVSHGDARIYLPLSPTEIDTKGRLSPNGSSPPFFTSAMIAN